MLKTGDLLSEFYEKKLLGITALKDQFRDVLVAAAANFAAHVWGTSGLFAAVDLDITVADELSCVTRPDGIDNQGRLIYPVLADVQGIAFENENLAVYHVALQRGVIKNGVERNPRTGAVHYQAEEEIVGVVGTPDSIIANPGGPGGTLFVDTITEAGVSCAGRTVRLYLATPLSADPAVAFLDRPVLWDGGNNYITTAEMLGQSDFSEVPADYVVALLGPTVLRNTDLSLDASVVYLGTVTGGGAGNPPSAKNTGGQRVFDAGGLAALAEVTRQDAHGFWKIRVRADSADASEKQIEVQDALGLTVFKVDEDGDVTMTSPVGATYSPTLGLVSGLGASFSAYIGTLAGVPHAKLMGLPIYIDGLLRANGVLSFRDLNATTAVEFSDASNIAIDPVLAPALLGASPSLLRAVNHEADQVRAFREMFRARLISGGAPTDGGGLNLDVAALVAWTNGHRDSVGDDAIALAPNLTRYVVYDGQAGSLVALDNNYAGVHQILLAKVVTGAAAIAEIVDLRVFQTNDITFDEVLVGPAESGAHFTKLSTAVRVVGELLTPPAGGVPRREIVVRVIGFVSEAEVDLPISIPIDDMTIVGGGRNAKVQWTGDVALFEINGKNRIALENLELLYDGWVSLVGDPQSRVVIACTPAATSTGCRLSNINMDALNEVGHGKVHGLINVDAAATIDGWIVSSCSLTGAVDFGIRVDGTANSCVFQNVDLTLDYAHASNGANRYGFYIAAGSRNHLQNVRVFTSKEAAFRLAAEATKMTDCRATSPRSHGIMLDSERNVARGCTVTGAGIDEAVIAHGIWVQGNRNFVAECDAATTLLDPPGTRSGITVSGDYNIVTGNQTNGCGLTVAVPANNTATDNRNDV